MITESKKPGWTVPVWFWISPRDIDPKAWDQIIAVASLPFAVDHVTVLPDCHGGYGMPIGTVLATDGTIVPNAVGVDIGCGMTALRTSIEARCLTKSNLSDIVASIYQKIPVGPKHHAEVRAISGPLEAKMKACPILAEEIDSARHSIGTLGGGNHFIELQAGDDGRLWVMIHSGSRNLGFRVCHHYNKQAARLNETWLSRVPKNAQLAFLPEGHILHRNYVSEMQACISFAQQNRAMILRDVMEIMQDDYDPSNALDICHNFAAMEHHHGRNVLIHRKGAAGPLRFNSDLGIIPGSMGTPSYLVAGDGENIAASFNSTSHGAGRTMSRSQARDTLDLNTEIDKVANVICSMNGRNKLDEAPGAYKDIQEVMALQSDLCSIKVTLTPLASIKG